MSRFVKLFVAGMFIFVPLLMVGSCVWNVMVYNDCRAHGKAMYQCQAMMNNPRYVAIDDVSNQ